MSQPSEFINAVSLFMDLGGQTTNEYNPEQATLYTGLQLEELAEKLEAIQGGAMTAEAHDRYEKVIGPMKLLADEFKAGSHRGDLMRAVANDVLDGDIDLAVVSIGAALSFCSDASCAAATVTEANLAKFPGGQVFRGSNGKIQKPPGWTPPDLRPYLHRD